jgi:putative aldouronate transport system permease protein|nr:ABC transporter permease subunit [uncultured Acetatifactor sp.]
MKKENKKRIPDRLYYWLMVLPGAIFVFLFNMRTWPGILGAFQDFVPVKGWYGSDWIGLTNFKIFFRQPNCFQIIRNTLVLAVGKIVFGQCMAILFALMLNEVRNSKLKKTIQTVTYLPHFVSWVIFASILRSILGSTGLVEGLLKSFGIENVSILGTASIFPAIMIATEVLKEFGWSAIIYLSALTAIDMGLYEAAEIDGATRLRQTIHVTLPGIRHIIVLNAVLSLGGILNAGFDQIFNMYNTLVMSTGDIIDTWVYRQGLISFNYGVGTAVGLFKSIIALILTVFAYWAADRFADYKIF